MGHSRKVSGMAVLGDLEQHVMAVLWRAPGPLLVREVHQALNYPREVAYTTVMTVLDRLAKKDAVARERDGRAWRYRPVKSCVDLHVDEILALLSGCGAGHADQILAGVQARLPEVVQVGRVSCGTTGDPSVRPPGRCLFLSACRSQGISCADCPSVAASASPAS